MGAKPATLSQAVAFYAQADAASEEVADSRWPTGIACVHCGAGSPISLTTRRIWKCSGCRKQFSCRTGTLLAESKIGLDKWLPAIWMVANSSGEVHLDDLGRIIGVTGKTAWYILHRVRLAMQGFPPGNPPAL